MARDFTKINGFVNEELGNLLLTDLYRFNVFNEGDMQACAYHHLRRFFQGNRHPNWIVRCQPFLRGGKEHVRALNSRGLIPDVCLFYRYKPVHVIELKFFPNDFDMSMIQVDIRKLKALRKHYPSIRVCFVVFIYDSDEMFPELTSYWRKKLALKGFCAVPINVRRKRATGRKRRDYRAWKKKWLRFTKKQK